MMMMMMGKNTCNQMERTRTEIKEYSGEEDVIREKKECLGKKDDRRF